MIKIIYLIGIAALIAGCVVLGLAAVQFRSAPETDQGPELSIVERFRQNGRNNKMASQPTVSPLVRRAEAFASYLSPPPVPARISKPAPPVRKTITKRAPSLKSTTLSAKFELHGISYYRSKPEQSMALVWEPGSGYRWIRQGAKLGHFIVEQIKSTSIVYRDAQRTHEMAYALDQITTRVAGGHKNGPAPGRPGESDRASPKPAPPRNVRVGPPAHVAAKSTSG